MGNKRKIAVFTGNRTEYGMLLPILQAIDNDPRLQLQLLVGGAHLKEDFGLTLSQIHKDGFAVAAQVESDLQTDCLHGTAQAIANGIKSLSDILLAIKPDCVLVPCDRFEGFAAMIAATQMSIATAHLEGGDYTEGGALDDSVRHAMTKLAHLHFVTNHEAGERVAKMGEEPWRIIMVGQPTLSLAAQGDMASTRELVEEFAIDLAKPVILFSQHSIALEYQQAQQQIMPALKALETLEKAAYQIVITYPNDDAGGRKIIAAIQQAFTDYTITNGKIITRENLGRYKFHGLLKLIGSTTGGAAVGNSSAFIKETPYFATPVVNIGSRQQGRLRADNIIDVGYQEEEIIAAVEKCTKDAEFIRQCAHCHNPYEAKNTGKIVAESLAQVNINSTLLKKKMTF